MSSRWVAVLVASFLVPAGQISAAELPVKVLPAATSVDYGNLYFGVDANTNQGLAGYSGILYAPGGMGTSGFRLSAFGMLGRYRYLVEGPPTETFNGRFVSGDLLVGYSQVFSNAAVTLSVGANVQDQRVNPFDPDNSVQGTKLGLKVQGDFWVNPTERTLVLGIASYSTAFDTYYSILRFGYDFIGNGVFIGPEFTALGNERTDQQRVGLHVTGLTILPRAKLTVSGGWLRERSEKDGGYVTANLDFSF